jgi:hypothetical protein
MDQKFFRVLQTILYGPSEIFSKSFGRMFHDFRTLKNRSNFSNLVLLLMKVFLESLASEFLSSLDLVLLLQNFFLNHSGHAQWLKNVFQVLWSRFTTSKCRFFHCSRIFPKSVADKFFEDPEAMFHGLENFSSAIELWNETQFELENHKKQRTTKLCALTINIRFLPVLRGLRGKLVSTIFVGNFKTNNFCNNLQILQKSYIFLVIVT